MLWYGQPRVTIGLVLTQAPETRAATALTGHVVESDIGEGQTDDGKRIA